MLKQVHKHQFLACKPRLQLGEMLRLRYPWNHTHSPPNLEGMSSDTLANYLPSLVAITLTQASNGHDKHRHTPRSIPTASKSRSLLCTLTHKACYSPSFHIRKPNWEIWFRMDSCPNVPKLVNKHQLLACKPRLQLGEMLQLWYPLNHTHSPPTLAQTSRKDVGMHTPTFDFLCLIQASNHPWKLTPPTPVHH